MNNFTVFLFALVISGQNLIIADRSIAQPNKTQWERQAEKRLELARDIVPLSHEPLYFLMRRGGHYDDESERYERMYQRANLEKMAAAGIRFGRLHFYKGFGLEYEREQIKESKKAAEIMHELGMKVSLYMAGTMFTETFYREVPQARFWEQRDQDDRWVPYGSQTFRHYACPNEPAYRDYIKKVLDIGIHELHADEIAFDNLMLQAEPKSCRCPRCIKSFQDFLRKRYPTRESLMRRFGLPDVEWIKVHEWSTPEQAKGISELNNPVLQEWVRFRCESLAHHVNDLHDYVKGLNPDVAVHLNIKGVYSHNRYWTNAVYHPLYKNRIDILSFDTGGYDARIDKETGALVSQIRSYKVARHLGAACTNDFKDDLIGAVHMAFNHETSVPGYPGATEDISPLAEFYREYNKRYYRDTDNVADVAVLRNWPSMAYSINATYIPATLMEQVLIQYKVPFDLIFDEELDQIDQYRAVILAGQECVADSQVTTLLQYVRKGGTLILTDNTGEYNGWRERRRVNPLLPARQEGKGRILYIPAIIPAGSGQYGEGNLTEDPEPGAALQRGKNISPPEWLLPANHKRIHETIKEGIPGGFSLECDAPLTTVMELLVRPKTKETIAHFVNFSPEQVNGIQVRIRNPYPAKAETVTWFTPDRDDPKELEFKEKDGEISFMVPQVGLYSMIVIGHK